MTREVLLLILGLPTLFGLVTVGMKSYLMYRAVKTRHAAGEQSPGSPEQITADDLILDSSGRILLAIAVASLAGLLFVSVLQSPEPATGVYTLMQAGILLLILLYILSIVELLQGVRGIVNQTRLTHALAHLRMPPEACAETTFERCPFISPERLLAIQSKAQELVDLVEPIAHEDGP